MKGKILLSVKLPATQGEYEFRVPLDSTEDEGAQLMAQVLSQREAAFYEYTGGVDLMVLAQGEGAGGQLNPNETFRALVEQGVLVDGSPVALV